MSESMLTIYDFGDLDDVKGMNGPAAVRFLFERIGWTSLPSYEDWRDQHNGASRWLDEIQNHLMDADCYLAASVEQYMLGLIHPVETAAAPFSIDSKDPIVLWDVEHEWGMRAATAEEVAERAALVESERGLVRDPATGLVVELDPDVDPAEVARQEQARAHPWLAKYLAGEPIIIENFDPNGVSGYTAIVYEPEYVWFKDGTQIPGVLSFKVLERDGTYTSPPELAGKPSYMASDPGGTTNPDEAEIVAGGSIKWDGCVNWEAGAECMVHHCDLEDFDLLTRTIRDALDAIYDIVVDHEFREALDAPYEEST